MHLSAEQGKAIEQAVKGEDGKLQLNPSARYVRGLTKGELTEMIGLDLSKRDNPRRAIAAFERLADDERHRPRARRQPVPNFWAGKSFPQSPLSS